MTRKPPSSVKEIVYEVAQKLDERLPEDWSVRAEPGTETADAWLFVRAPARPEAVLRAEVKSRMGPRDVVRLVSLRGSDRPDHWIAVAPYLSPGTRARLEEAAFNYADLTGNVRIATRSPSMFVASAGSDRDPWPADSPLRSLRGASAGRVVRAVVDHRPPFRLTDLANWSGAPVATVHRVIRLLADERLIERSERGPVVEVEWDAVIRRWADDYSLLSTNSTRGFVAPRGVDRLVDDLRRLHGRYAVSGSLAAVRRAPVAEARLAVIYVDGPLAARARELALRESDAATNVILAEPFDEVVFEGVWVADDGIRCAAPSQVAVDLLTSPGRGPAEGERLIAWMATNEHEWRS